VAITIGSYFVRDVPANAPTSGADFAGACDLGENAPLRWPAGASVLAPPNLGIQILAAEPDGQATVVATPHHPAWRGIERAYRFLDPRTPDPRRYLDESRATHVAVCALRDGAAPNLEKAFPLTMQLVEGHPPEWLVECPLSPRSTVRVFRYPTAGGVAADCPTMATSPDG
jgi:hypothetical protein